MRLILAIVLLLVAASAQAYIGPGAGIPVIGSLIGIVVTVVVAIGAILLWPIRKLLKRGKAKNTNAENSTENASSTSDDSSTNDEIVDAVVEKTEAE